MFKLTDTHIRSFLNGGLVLSVHKRYKEEMITFCRNNCKDNKWYMSNVHDYIHFKTYSPPIYLMTKNHVKVIKNINKTQKLANLEQKKKDIEEEIRSVENE